MLNKSLISIKSRYLNRVFISKIKTITPNDIQNNSKEEILHKITKKSLQQDQSIPKPFTPRPTIFVSRKIIDNHNLNKIFQSDFYEIKDIKHLREIFKYIDSVDKNLDRKQILTILDHLNGFLRLQTYIHLDIIDQVRTYIHQIEMSKENYLQFLSVKLIQKIDKNYCLFICDILSALFTKYTLTPTEVVKIYENCFPIYSYIKNSLFYVGEADLTEQQICEYEKTLQVSFAYEKQLIYLHNTKIYELTKIYSLLSFDTKMKICKLMKKTRLFNHFFMEQLSFEVQSNWKQIDLRNLIDILSTMVRSGQALPYELIYNMRDHFHSQNLDKYTVIDKFKILDIFVRSRIKFNDILIEKFFMNLIEQNDFSILSSTDKVMCLYLYSKSFNFKDQRVLNFFIKNIEQIIDQLNFIQIKIFLSALALVNYEDQDLFFRLKRQIDLKGYIGQLQEYGKLSDSEKLYFELIINQMANTSTNTNEEIQSIID